MNKFGWWWFDVENQVVTLGRDLIGNLRSLIGALKSRGIQALDENQQLALAKQAGLIWNACDALNTLPIQNKFAVTKVRRCCMLTLVCRFYD